MSIVQRSRFTVLVGVVWFAACGTTADDTPERATAETSGEEAAPAVATPPPCSAQRSRREYHFVQFAYYADGQYGVRDTLGVDERSDDPAALVRSLQYTLENTPEDDGGEEGPGADFWVVDGDRRDELIVLVRRAGVRNVRVCTDTTGELADAVGDDAPRRPVIARTVRGRFADAPTPGARVGPRAPAAWNGG